MTLTASPLRIGTTPSATNASRSRSHWRVGRRPVLLLLLPVVIVLLVAGVAWQRGVKWWFIPRNFAAVEPGQLYRSGQLSEPLIERVLTEHKIGLVVFMSGDKMVRPFIRKEIETVKALGIERVNCPLRGDGTGGIEQYAAALDAIVRAERGGIPALVHCHTGAQRTGGAIGFYRMLVQGKGGAEAFAEMRRYGHDPSKNPHLVPYMNQNMGELAEMLVTRGVIDRVPSPLPIVGP